MRIHKVTMIVVAVLTLLSYGCDKRAPQGTVQVQEAADIFRDYAGKGLQARITEPTIGYLTINRTGTTNSTKTITVEYQAGDVAAFGHRVVAFMTRAGITETKFTALLLRIRADDTRRSSDVQQEEFFLDDSVARYGGPAGSSSWHSPLKYGETLGFRVLSFFGGTNEIIRLSIRFEAVTPRHGDRHGITPNS